MRVKDLSSGGKDIRRSPLTHTLHWHAGQLKVLLAAKMGKSPRNLRLFKWQIEYKDHITLSDYEIHDGFNLVGRPRSTSPFAARETLQAAVA